MSWKGSDFDSIWRIKYSYLNEQKSSTTMANAKVEATENKTEMKDNNRKQKASLSSSLLEHHSWGISAHVGLEGFDPSSFTKARKHHHWKDGES